MKFIFNKIPTEFREKTIKELNQKLDGKKIYSGIYNGNDTEWYYKKTAYNISNETYYVELTYFFEENSLSVQKFWTWYIEENNILIPNEIKHNLYGIIVNTLFDSSKIMKRINQT